MEPVDVLRTRFPALEIRDVRVIEDGWDSLVLEVDGTWIFRFPRRPEVEEWMEREVALLPELAGTLLIEVPRFEFVGRNGVLCVGYRKLAGLPATAGLGDRAGSDLGLFLTALHAFPIERTRAIGIPCLNPETWRGWLEGVCEDFRRRVFPLLRAGERQRSESLFARASSFEFVPVLIHADLGPEHVLCLDGRVKGVIDWSDARVGDAALDFAWCLNGTPKSVVDSLTRICLVDDDLRNRSLFYHQLGPWYEVVYGLETSQERFVESGLEGVRSRLPT